LSVVDNLRYATRVARTKVVVITRPDLALPGELDDVRAVADVVIAETPAALRESGAEVALVWDFQTPLFARRGPGA
jgi:hypothetical protein